MKTHIRLALSGSIGNSIGFLILLLFIQFERALSLFAFWQLVWMAVYVFGDLYLGLKRDAKQDSEVKNVK